MARPTDKFVKGFEPNLTWKGPTPDVLDLHAHQSPTDMGVRSISCWEFEPGELQEVIRTGKVYLHVFGMHPVVWVSSAIEVVGESDPEDEPSILAAQLAEAKAADMREFERLQAENARFREALEYYASAHNYGDDDEVEGASAIPGHMTTSKDIEGLKEAHFDPDYGVTAVRALLTEEDDFDSLYHQYGWTSASSFGAGEDGPTDNPEAQP